MFFLSDNHPIVPGENIDQFTHITQVTPFSFGMPNVPFPIITTSKHQRKFVYKRKSQVRLFLPHPTGDRIQFEAVTPHIFSIPIGIVGIVPHIALLPNR